MKTTTTWIQEQIKWVKEHPDLNHDIESFYKQIETILEHAQSVEKSGICLAFVEGQSDILKNGASKATLATNYFNQRFNNQ